MFRCIFLQRSQDHKSRYEGQKEFRLRKECELTPVAFSRGHSDELEKILLFQTKVCECRPRLSPSLCQSNYSVSFSVAIHLLRSELRWKRSEIFSNIAHIFSINLYLCPSTMINKVFLKLRTACSINVHKSLIGNVWLLSHVRIKSKSQRGQKTNILQDNSGINEALCFFLFATFLSF